MADIYTKATCGPIFTEQRERNLGEKFKTTEETIAAVPKIRRARRNQLSVNEWWELAISAELYVHQCPMRFGGCVSDRNVLHKY